MDHGQRPLTSLEPISVRIPEAVRMTGLSRSAIYELMRDGDIEFAKVGRSTLIPVDSLRRFVDSRRVPRRQTGVQAPDVG